MTVLTQPAPQTCTVANGSGTISAANVTNISVVCLAPLAVSSTTPADGETNVSRTVAPAVVFSAAVDPLTATHANITLGSAAGSASAAVNATGTQVTLTPARQLLPLTQYTLTATTGVKAQSGELLPSAVTRRFTTRDGAWGTPALIATEKTEFAFDPSIAVDAAGNALAVWCQRDGEALNIWANRYVVGAGWGVATMIEADELNISFGEKIAMDPAGNALAVWLKSDGRRSNIWSNRYAVGTGWGTATMIETEPGHATDPEIAMNASGNGVVVWSSTDGTRYRIWSNRYLVDTGWGPATLIDTGAGDAGKPQIVVDANGNALAVWSQREGPRLDIWSNRYVVGTGWGAAALIETDDSGNAFEAKIVMDTRGNAIAAWSQRATANSVRTNVWANRYSVDTGWGTAALIEVDDVGDARQPHIAMDSAGNTLAVWQQSDGTRDNIWSNRYVVGTGWGVAALVDADDTGNAILAQISVDASGNALAVWQQADETLYSIWANRYVAGKGWGVAARIEANDAGDAAAPQIVMDATGSALVVWNEEVLSEEVNWRIEAWAVRFE